MADGAMGTEIYNRGFFVNACYDHLNISSPKTILDIHGEYLQAGAEILTANTFGANRIHLTSFGLQESLKDVIAAGVKLAKSVAGDNAYVAGSVGPVSQKLIQKSACTPNDVRNAYREQLELLLEAGVDYITLETFTSWSRAKEVYDLLRGISNDAPCTVSFSIATFGFSQEAHVTSTPEAAERIEKASGQLTPEQLAETIVREWGENGRSLPIVGLNCGGGPEIVLQYFSRFAKALPKDALTTVMPNAGSPQYIDGRTLYLASPEYMAEFCRRYVTRGARIIGGCCGTNPKMIREMRSYLRQAQPGRVQISTSVPDPEVELLEPIPLLQRSVWAQKIGQKFAVSVELDPPKGLDIFKALEGAKFLSENGIDAINIADGPRASGRINPLTLALKVREVAEIETIVHVCARDRNVLALQMDLMSYHLLGIRNLMLITGDPPKMGLYPNATAVFDMEAIGLVRSAVLLNQGVDLAMRSVGARTSFVIGVGCNPGADNFELEVERFEKKVEAGAEFVFSQPVYDIALLEKFLKATDHVKSIPFFVGILPLASLRNAEFLTENVPGMEVPEEIRRRLALASTKEAQRQEGIAIAAEALAEAKRMTRVQGAYIFPPFGRYASIIDVLEKAS